MQKIICCLYILVISATSIAQQNSYVSDLQKYQQDYLQSHEVVMTDERQYMHFFPVNEKFKITAVFKKLSDTSGFIMKTSGTIDKKFFRYGTASFSINDTAVTLTIYQSEKLMTDSGYESYLFLPFTDATSGEESYGGGRYIDLDMKRIRNNKIVIDFNKAYNPYCAYSTGYNCPIPPRENDMPVAIRAGEMDFLKPPSH